MSTTVLQSHKINFMRLALGILCYVILRAPPTNAFDLSEVGRTVIFLSEYYTSLDMLVLFLPFRP